MHFKDELRPPHLPGGMGCPLSLVSVTSWNLGISHFWLVLLERPSHLHVVYQLQSTCTHVYHTGALQSYAVVTRIEMLQVQRAPKRVKTQTQIVELSPHGQLATFLIPSLLGPSLPARAGLNSCPPASLSPLRQHSWGLTSSLPQ